MTKLGVITIGQAPRKDVAPILREHLPARVDMIQAGVLDGLSKEYIAGHLQPGEHDYALTSRLATGESVVMGRSKIQPILQQKIDEMENRGVANILLLCTGVFPGLAARSSYLIEPDHIIPPAVKAMVGNRRLGVIVPLEEQKETMNSKYEPHGLHPVYGEASPYVFDRGKFQAAAAGLKGKADILLLDCMGYTEEARKLTAEASGLPVILSNAIMAKIVSEMI
ncbi:AroM family protein [Paenibacillus sp. VCA1]|uniref:AroM family protein n=1 Tax=Paenibacillus sp. VCA1 TaxID=3039148 RepID=UPI002871D194|nr:AroM family protein [Paenibacillus sp. VCA1]MDR9853247.1 AroM family protein [Paenibacillus sp. VCA1]